MSDFESDFVTADRMRGALAEYRATAGYVVEMHDCGDPIDVEVAIEELRDLQIKLWAPRQNDGPTDEWGTQLAFAMKEAWEA